MKDTKLSRIKIVFVVVITAMVVLYVYLVAPYFMKDIDSLRKENKQIEHDLSEINKMGEDGTAIKASIKTAQKELEALEKQTEIDDTNFDMDISEKAEKVKVEISEIVVEEPKAVGKTNQMGKRLYLQPATISFKANFKEGIKFIKNLESSDTGMYKVKDFLYSKSGENDEKAWMVSVELYYYKAESDKEESKQ